jgi:hypothetical protein
MLTNLFPFLVYKLRMADRKGKRLRCGFTPVVGQPLDHTGQKRIAMDNNNILASIASRHHMI